MKPMARSASWQGHSCSLPGSSRNFCWPEDSSVYHSIRTVFTARTWPLSSPRNSFDRIPHSRRQPSSCEELVRRITGQFGHGVFDGRWLRRGYFPRSGGCGSSSNCVRLFAPCRLLVPSQSEPVSPPPITTTSLPSARICPCTSSPAFRLFCCGRNSIA